MSLLLSSTFLVFAIVVRISIQYYYTGDHGIRLAKRSAPFIEIIPGITFVFSFIVSFVLIIFNNLKLLPVDNSLSETIILAATLIGFSGIAITVIAQIQMGRSWRIGVDQNETTTLIVTGLYSKSRNPIYFGILLYWLAIAVNFPHPAMWVCAVICWISIEIIVRKIEEPYLKRVHGRTFEDYGRKTNRYLIL